MGSGLTLTCMIERWLAGLRKTLYRVVKILRVVVTCDGGEAR